MEPFWGGERGGLAKKSQLRKSIFQSQLGVLVGYLPQARTQQFIKGVKFSFLP